jgi:hypothetical protein
MNHVGRCFLKGSSKEVRVVVGFYKKKSTNRKNIGKVPLKEPELKPERSPAKHAFRLS